MRTQGDKCHCRARHRMWEHKERGTDARVAANCLFVTDNWHVLFMSPFSHLENGKVTVLSSQPPPSRLTKEISSQKEGRERVRELCFYVGVSALSVQCRPGISSAVPPL